MVLRVMAADRIQIDNTLNTKFIHKINLDLVWTDKLSFGQRN